MSTSDSANMPTGIVRVAFEALVKSQGPQKVVLAPNGMELLRQALDVLMPSEQFLPQLRELFIFSCFVRDEYSAPDAADAIVEAVTGALERAKTRGFLSSGDEDQAATLRMQANKLLGRTSELQNLNQKAPEGALKPWQRG